MWLAPMRSRLAGQKMSDYEGAMGDWLSFSDETKTYYGVDMSVLTKPFSEEQKKYYLQVNATFHRVLTSVFLKSISITTNFFFQS